MSDEKVTDLTKIDCPDCKTKIILETEGIRRAAVDAVLQIIAKKIVLNGFLDTKNFNAIRCALLGIAPPKENMIIIPPKR